MLFSQRYFRAIENNVWSPIFLTPPAVRAAAARGNKKRSEKKK